MTILSRGIARRRNAKGLEVASGCLDVLSKKVGAITWRTAADLEEWEKEHEEDESCDFDLDLDAETCVVEVRLSKKDRRAIADLMAALEKAGKGESE